MPALTADRTPEQLVAELEQLVGVDWPTVWRGVPEDTGKRTYWCAGFGWRPLWTEAGLRVRTALGGRLYLAFAAAGRPVTRVEHTVWAARARDVDENRRVADLAAARWDAHLTALRGLMGNPTWHGTWDTPDFPELPGRGPWYSPAWRLEHRDPYRLAVWRFRTPGAPLIELKMTLGLGSETAPAVADARIALSCHDPQAPEVRGPLRQA
ncbi:hypothetical protein [Streptomyces avermitilis]|uniref:hypothetical protein n=1 Tax=Streptomyces avermitilis TaxID=33903 RepID=UPI0033BB628D